MRSRRIAFSTAAALVFGAALTCAPLDRSLLPPFPEGGPKWVTCQIMETEASVTATIVANGPAQTLQLPRGHRLEVPANALDSGGPVQIRFAQLPGPHVRVLLTPPNQTWGDSLTLILSYDGRGCDTTGAPLTVYRVHPKGSHQPLPPPAQPTPPGTVGGLLDHFSAFAIAR